MFQRLAGRRNISRAKQLTLTSVRWTRKRCLRLILMSGRLIFLKTSPKRLSTNWGKSTNWWTASKSSKNSKETWECKNLEFSTSLALTNKIFREFKRNWCTWRSWSKIEHQSPSQQTMMPRVSLSTCRCLRYLQTEPKQIKEMKYKKLKQCFQN